MRRVVFPLFLTLTGFTIFFSSWSVLHGDIHWISDIARDTFILEEIGFKKLILIGPRASGGLFHRPLWPYMNYPGFILGNGNPVIIGWYWIFLMFFLGYFSLTLFNRFNLLDFYIFPLFSLVFLIFSSFISSRYSRLFLAIFAIMYVLNQVGLSTYIQQENATIGKGQYS